MGSLLRAEAPDEGARRLCLPPTECGPVASSHPFLNGDILYRGVGHLRRHPCKKTAIDPTFDGYSFERGIEKAFYLLENKMPK